MSHNLDHFESQPNMKIINRIYCIENVIGKGSFGVVYRGYHTKTLEPIAIKTEHVNNKMKILKHESNILNHLYRRGCRCVSPIYYYGLCSQYLCLVIKLFTKSLEDYMREQIIWDVGEGTHTDIIKQNKCLLHKVMFKMIDIIENIHCYDIIHRDLKPQNFMIDSHNNIYLIDFGMATTYISANTGKHIDIASSCSREFILGNPKYMSYNLYEGYEPVRRDDLISIGYMYLYFLCGSLPWDVIPDNVIDLTDSHSILHIEHYKNKYYKIKKNWDSLYNTLLVYDDPIKDYMRYCYRLEFESTPNYDGLKDLFALLLSAKKSADLVSNISC